MRTRAEITQEDKVAVRSVVSEAIQKLSDSRAVCVEAIANEAFYWLQRHPQWGRNASSTHKKVSYRHWKGKCHRCKQSVTFEDAKFHHLHRGVSGQHEPSNLVPQHLHCHDEEHGAVKGSLSKGSPVKQSGPTNHSTRSRVRRAPG